MEFADFAIRTFDVKGALRFNKSADVGRVTEWRLTERRDSLVRQIRRGTDAQWHWDTFLQAGLRDCKPGIIEAIEDKMLVNEARPYRHGNLKA